MILLVPLALAHGPHEAATLAASLDEHERYALPDPLPEAPAAAASFDTPELLGSYRLSTLEAALEEKKLAVRTCYQIGLDDAAHPAGTGRIVFQTTLYPSLLRSSFTIGTNTLAHPETEDCVARVLKTLELPAPTRGVVTISIPIDFEGRPEE